MITTMELPKLFLTICFLIFFRSLAFNQNNRQLSYAKKRIDFLQHTVTSIKVLNNEDKYKETVNAFVNCRTEACQIGYPNSVDLNFFKIATKFKSKDSIYFALHFELEKGASMTFIADVYSITKDAHVVLFNINGKKIFKYDSSLLLLNDKTKMFEIGGRLIPQKNVIFLVAFSRRDKIKRSKIHLKSIIIAIADIHGNLRPDENE